MLAQPATLPTAPAPASGRGLRRAGRRCAIRNTYAIRVRRHDPRDCQLFTGDVIIIRRLQHGAHETATAEINQRTLTLEQLIIKRDGLHLIFAGDERPAVFLHNRDIEVLSLVMGTEHHATEH
ncbi:hypothetical protein [Halomonas garicola]|uniref:hypothetical protein n=1 Tax=Halomonas garicola TaxID=1690008 RepID=UPI002897B291|nr:hypothetical protein [Halomonas garicola]